MRRMVVLAALVVAGLTLSVPSAAADDGSLLVDVPGDSVGFTHDPGAPLVKAERLAPGVSRSGTFAVRNTFSGAASLGLRVFDLTDAENGCLAPETRVPGEECDADGGELADWLDVTVARDDATAETLWSGDFGDLAAGVELTDALPAGATWPLRITVALPLAATNDTMSDEVSFGVRLTAESNTGYSDVLSPIGDVGGSPGPSATGGRAQVAAPTSRLLGGLVAGPRVGVPMTEASISLAMMFVDLAVLLLATFLVVLARRLRFVGTRP